VPRRALLLLPGALSVIAVVCGILTSSGRAQTTAGGGQVLFEKRCSGCHAMDREKEGPHLGGVYGRAAGSVASFQYSEALKNSKITWNAETLDRWLIDPERVVPGSDMAFHVDRLEERRDIIAYLKRGFGK
jgi:cytochrome c